MRRDPGLPRGEAGRVAQRVRAVVSEGAFVRAAPDATGAGPDAFDSHASHPGALGHGPRDPEALGPGRLDRVLARLPVRLDPGRRAALAIGVAVLVTALATGLWMLSQRPRALAVPASASDLGQAATLAPTAAATGGPAGRSSSSPSGAAGTSSAPGPASVAASAEVVVVHVAGRVHRPGLYRLPTGSRVDDALRAAGGALRGVDLSRLNLAAKLVDGEQIPVGLPGGVAAPPNSGGGVPGAGSSVAAAGPVDLNTATLDQLDSLPGVGPVLAQHVLDWRAQHTRFDSVDQLNDVSGIGDVKFGELKPLVTV